MGVQREGKLPQRCADIGAFEGALRGAHLDELVVGEDDGAGAVAAKVVGVLSVVFEHGGGLPLRRAAVGKGAPYCITEV